MNVEQLSRAVTDLIHKFERENNKDVQVKVISHIDSDGNVEFSRIEVK